MELRITRPRYVCIGLCIAVLSSFHRAGEAYAQAGSNSPIASGQTPASAPAKDQSSQPGWIVRDPRTGRFYHQQLITASVPTTTWESKPVSQTVYEPQVTSKNVATQQTTYSPVTQYVLQPKIKGLWNPFRQPVTSYEYQPVTSWIPQTQTINQPVLTQQWVAKQRTVYVPQPVQKMQAQQQLVQTEVPQPNSPISAMATRPPLITLPIPARRRIIPWNPVQSPATSISASSLATVANSGLRPITNPINEIRGSTYTAPLRTASSTADLRDSIQAGMSATILR